MNAQDLAEILIGTVIIVVMITSVQNAKVVEEINVTFLLDHGKTNRICHSNDSGVSQPLSIGERWKEGWPRSHVVGKNEASKEEHDFIFVLNESGPGEHFAVPAIL